MTHPEALVLIDYINKSRAKLHDWERGLIGQVKAHYHISNKQAVYLQKIYARVTGGGLFEKREYI